MGEILALVEARLRTALGEPDARASVTFLGTDRIEVLRFQDSRTQDSRSGSPDGGSPDAGSVWDGGSASGPDAVVRYVTLGMSAQPMADPSALLADTVKGPRAELIITVRAGLAETDQVLRPLATLAASPQVEGVVVASGGSLDLGAPLWPGAPFQSVLVGESGGLVPDLELDAPLEPVRFLPLLPMTPNEAAWKRVRGAQELQERWLANGTDLRDPLRRSTSLD